MAELDMTPREKIGMAVTEENAPKGVEERERRSFPELLIILAKHKRFIISFVGSVAVLSAIVSLLLTKTYTATTRLMPPQPGQSIASAMLSQLGGLAPLIGGSVGNLGLKNPNDLYISMLRSRTVGDRLVDRFHLMSIYHQKMRAGARKSLAMTTEIAASAKSGVITISVEDANPSRAADIANAYVTELENLTKTLAVTDATKRRMFFEKEAKGASDDLARAEQALEQTEETTGMISLDSQAKLMLGAYAELRAQAAAKEVQIEAMRSFATAENPDLKREENELAALRAQINHYERGQGGNPMGDIALEKVPAKALSYIRALREVKYREALLELMLKQYEAARIDESRDSAVIQVLDKAIVPEQRTWPPRTALVLASTLLALIAAIASVLLMEKVNRAIEDPQFAAQFQLFKFYLRGKHNS